MPAPSSAPARHLLPAPAHTLPAAAVLQALGSDGAAGLPEAVVAARRTEWGPNQLAEKVRTPPWRRLLAQFQDFMIYVLLAAVALSALEGQVLEPVAILAILLLNGILGFVQEHRAEAALDALEALAAPAATVIRAGSERDVPAAELVPGDLVCLEAGDQVPADGRLVEAVGLRMVEGTLTGESQPARKQAAEVVPADAAIGDRRNCAFAGTAVAAGRGRLVVTATGQGTEVGRIAGLLASTQVDPTPLQKELAAVGKRIALVVLAIAAVVFLEEAWVAWVAWRGLGGQAQEALADPTFRAALTAGLLVAVSLAVAAIPEGLPAIVTVALSQGVRRMAERHAIVRRLRAVETLGSTTFICTDKTGTLTRNEMAVRLALVGTDAARITGEARVEPTGPLAPAPADLALLLEVAAANNDAHLDGEGVLVGDPTEVALLAAARALAPELRAPPRVAEIPFDSERKRMTTLHDLGGRRVAYVKGGAEVVLALCTGARLRGQVVALDEPLRAVIRAGIAQVAASGHRALAFAVRDLGPPPAPADPVGAAEPSVPVAGEVERDLTWLGLLGLVDPPRPEVHQAIAQCHGAGIRVAMVTGDQALTARAIAADVGLLGQGRVVEGRELAAMSDAELSAQVDGISVFARVDPEHKLRIVDALKARGHVVAMTGDGVNDAPALKRADIGVAMGRVGTDVARQAADMVLADDDFATIVAAVAQGRVVFDNLRKVILFLLSCNISEVLVVFVTALVTPAAALLPLQLLWLNLITDGLPALALGVDPAEPGVMARRPRKLHESILTGRVQLGILGQGVVMTAACLSLFYLVAPRLPGTNPGVERTMLFCALVLTQLLHAFDFRSATATVWRPSSLRNRWLVLGTVGSLALQGLVVYWPAAQAVFRTAPLSAVHWLAVAGTAVAAVAVMDAAKLLRVAVKAGRRSTA